MNAVMCHPEPVRRSAPQDRLREGSGWVRTVAALLLVVAVSACGFFKRQQKEYFSLDTIPSATGVAAISGAPIGVDAFELPPGIDRREITVREENGRLELRGTELWAAPIETMVVHTLAFDLAARAPEGMIVLPGQAKPVDAMRSVYVVAEEFGAGPGQTLVLDARIVIRAPGGASNSTRHERIEVPLESLDSAQIATGMSRALATLADRIIAAL